MHNTNTSTENDKFIMLPRNDFAFKMLFGNENNKELLIDLLAAIFNQETSQLADLEYINTDLLKDIPENKQGILDIRIKQADGRQINVEIQVNRIETMVHRSLFYWSRMYATQLGTGEKYGLLRPCITINIVNFIITTLESPHTTWHITEDQTKEQLTDLFEMHFLELPKLDKTTGQLSKKLEGWMRFIAAKSREELAMLAKQDDIYNRAYQQLEVLSMDETTRRQYEAREAWLKDEATRQYEAKQSGRLEGLREGELKGRKEGLQEGLQKGELKGRKEGLQEGEVRGEIQNQLNSIVALLDVLDDAIIANKLSVPLDIVQRLRAGDDVENIKAELLAKRTAIHM